MQSLIISLGGSIVVPDSVDVAFVAAFRDVLKTWLEENDARRAVLIVGGGAPARRYQQALKSLRPEAKDEDGDWVGIAATHLNATFVKMAFGELAPDPIVTNPTADFEWTGRVLVAGGWKPGFSTDNDAVLLAERFGADTVLNLSNIAHIYSADPKLDPEARPLETLSWEELLKMIGTEWSPGKHVPLDPVAAARGAKLGLKIITAKGNNLENFARILAGEDFEGTTVHP